MDITDESIDLVDNGVAIQLRSIYNNLTTEQQIIAEDIKFMFDIAIDVRDNDNKDIQIVEGYYRVRQRADNLKEQYSNNEDITPVIASIDQVLSVIINVLISKGELIAVRDDEYTKWSNESS